MTQSRTRLSSGIMLSSLRNRAAAVLMLLLFLAGSLGVSSLDAVLFHENSQDNAPLLHVEGVDSECHTSACVVGFVINQGGFLAAQSEGSAQEFAVLAVQLPMDRYHRALPARLISALPRSPPATL